MFNFLKKNSEKNKSNHIIIGAPVQGTCIPLSDVKDEVFSLGMLGEGVGIIPSDGTVKAPSDGVVETVFPTMHAYGITTTDGAEVLIHIGIDTVEMNGEGFTANVSQGQKVHAGEMLGTFSIDKIKEKGYDSTVIVVISNTPEFKGVTAAGEKMVAAGDEILTVERGA